MDYKIYKINESYLQVECKDVALQQEIYESFKIRDKNYKKTPYGRWDGYIRFFTKHRCTMPLGLLSELLLFIKKNKNSIYVDESVKTEVNNIPTDAIDDWIDNFDSSLTDKHGKGIHLWDNQRLILKKSMIHNKRVFVSNTSSGKSLSIYGMVRQMLDFGVDGQILIIVPSAMLRNQLYDDFVDYSQENDFQVGDHVMKMTTGKMLDSKSKILISTWQLIQKQSQAYFNRFGAVVVDEVHGASANKLNKILSFCTNASFKKGLTGTLRDENLHEYQVSAYLGKIDYVQELHEAQADGTAAKTKIKMVELRYEKEDCKKRTYENEIQFIIHNDSRNKYIADLANSFDTNTMIIVSRLDHIDELLKLMPDSYVISGAVKDRDSIKKELETVDGKVLIATYKTLSTGISINNLHNLILASPLKARITVLQTLGRLVRLHIDKKYATIIDLIDNLAKDSYNINHTMNHAVKRYQMFRDSKQDVEMKYVNIVSEDTKTKQSEIF